MKRIIVLLSTLLIIGGCRSESEVGYNAFFSDEKDTLSILVVDVSLDNFSATELEAHGIDNLITKVHQTTSLDLEDNKYGLKLKEKPAYVVFTNDQMIYTTYSKDDLFSFLKDYKK